jgi:chromosome segregation ATPase
MPKNLRHRVLKISFLCLACALAIAVSPIFTPAQSTSQLEFRITQLEGQIAELRGQIYSLQSQGSRVNRPVSPNRPSSSRTNPRMLSGDPMFDNLATLAIETKQDVLKIQERLSKLEASRNR